jgi:hypothetical protein
MFQNLASPTATPRFMSSVGLLLEPGFEPCSPLMLFLLQLFVGLLPEPDVETTHPLRPLLPLLEQTLMLPPRVITKGSRVSALQ